MNILGIGDWAQSSIPILQVFCKYIKIKKVNYLNIYLKYYIF